jgi:hypothetical protein
MCARMQAGSHGRSPWCGCGRRLAASRLARVTTLAWSQPWAQQAGSQPQNTQPHPQTPRSTQEPATPSADGPFPFPRQPPPFNTHTISHLADDIVVLDDVDRPVAQPRGRVALGVDDVAVEVGQRQIGAARVDRLALDLGVERGGGEVGGWVGGWVADWVIGGVGKRARATYNPWSMALQAASEGF